jgi:hypothetical protein
MNKCRGDGREIYGFALVNYVFASNMAADASRIMELWFQNRRSNKIPRMSRARNVIPLKQKAP